MKTILLALALFASAAQAQTATIEWWLRPLGGPDIAPYTTQTNCSNAAKARAAAPGSTITYECPWRLRVTMPCGPKPANDTQPGVCPAGQIVAVPWTRTRSYFAAPAPTCWTMGTWTPSTPPPGSCVTPPPTVETWTRIATENQPFTVGTNQTVRYGKNGPYVQKVVSSAGTCSNDFFGSDPAPGEGKFCDVLEGSGTPITNPPPAPPTTPTLGSATLSWAAPTKSADGTALTDLAGYRVQYGTTSGSYTASVDTSASSTSITIPSLTSGTWFFVVRAFDTSGNASAPSPEVSKTIP